MEATAAMESKRTILVTGATGAQGGGVAHHLLQRGKFSVRGLTRNPNSEKAQALRSARAEVVKGDLEDPESLRAALKGCYGCFGVTNFWEHFARELDQGKNLVDAVRDSDVEHFVFSTLPHVKKATNGELDVPHFDLKAQLEDYTRELELPATFLHVAFYFDNFLAFLPPQKGEDGTYSIGFPQGEVNLSGVAAEDVGGVVAVIFERPEEFIGETVRVLGDDLPPQEYAEVMTRVSGKGVSYNYIPRETFASFGFPSAEELADMFDFYRRFPPYDANDLARSRALYSGMQTFEQWLSANRKKFLAALG